MSTIIGIELFSKTLKLIVKATNLDLTVPLGNYLERKMNGIERFLRRWLKEGVIEARVELARNSRHHRHGKVFRAEVNLRLPGRILRAEAGSEDIRIAIDEVKNKLQQQINKYKNRLE